MKTLKKIVSGTFLLAILGGGGYAFWWWNDGVSHRDIYNTVKDESSHVQSRIDTRCDAIDSRGRTMDEKLDRIEAKLDALIKLATTPQPSDGLQPLGY